MPRKIDPVEAAVRRFARGVAGGEDLEALANLDLLLQVRVDYLDGDPYTWQAGDLTELLLEVCPRKVQSDGSLVADGPAVLGRYLAYLEQTGQLLGVSVATLQAELAEVAPQFSAAMADTSRFGLAKSIFAGVGADGVDPEGLEAVMARFNDLSFEERKALTDGPLGLSDDEDDEERPPLPPVVLAPEHELRSMAASAVLVQRVGALLDFVGPKGRQVTQTGALKVADAKALAAACGDEDRLLRPERWMGQVRRMADLSGVEEAYELAVGSGLLDVHGTRVRRDDEEPGVADELLRAESLALMALEIGVFIGEGPMYMQQLVDGVSDQLVGILAALYAAREPVEVAEINEELVDHLGVVPHHHDTARAYLERALARLERLGMVARHGVHVPQEHARLGLSFARATSVELTPLGVWWFQRMATDHGVPAPLVGELAEVSAVELCEGLAGFPVEEGLAELAGWRAHRGEEQAARELASLLASTDVVHRQFALHLLDSMPGAEAAIRPLLDDPVARPSARLWLVSSGFEVAAEYHRPEDDLQLFVDSAGMLVEVGATDELLASLGQLATGKGEEELVRQLWRVESPMTEPLLNALSAGAPPAISKAARKALHSLRSARASR